VTDFKYVGIEYSVEPLQRRAEVKMTNERWNKVKSRCKRIRKIGHSTSQRKRLLAVAVAPIIRYGAPWRTYDDKTNTTLAREIERTVINGSGNIWCGRSPWLIWNVHLGGELHPQFIQDYEALCFQVRRNRKHRASDRHGLTKANFDAVCHRWQWKRLSETVVLTSRGDMDIDLISKATAIIWPWMAGRGGCYPKTIGVRSLTTSTWLWTVLTLHCSTDRHHG
jgi:hypothetical protein